MALVDSIKVKDADGDEQDIRTIPERKSSAMTTTHPAIDADDPVEVLAVNANRKFFEITNDSDTIKVFMGDDDTLTVANGHVLKPGAAFSLDYHTGAVWLIAESGTPVVTVMEVNVTTP